MFRPNWTSSGVQVVVFHYSAADFNATSCNFLLCVLQVVVFGFVRFADCGCLECSFWGGVLQVVIFGFVRFTDCGCLECSFWDGNFVVRWSAMKQ
jgi:hypothetical protein